MGEIRTGPRERLVFLDLARGLAIVFMVLQHAVLLFATGQGEGSVLGKIVLLLGGAPAAPVFLFIMGIFLGRPDRKIGRGVRRGLKLIALGYLLNLLRSTLPSLFTGPEIASATVPASPLASFWAVDILQMAGLSFVLLTLLRRYLPFRWVWAILAAAVAFVSPLLWHWDGPSGVYALWGNRDDVFFPLFPWVVYPLAGMVYGPCSFEAEDRGRAVKRRAVIGTLFFAVGGATFFLPRMGGIRHRAVLSEWSRGTVCHCGLHSGLVVLLPTPGETLGRFGRPATAGLLESQRHCRLFRAVGSIRLGGPGHRP